MVTEQIAGMRHDEESQWELMTPGAAAYLFGISEAAVRAARLRGDVRAPVVMGITGKDVYLLEVQSALDYWGDSRQPDLDELERMRRNKLEMSADDDVYHLLHTRPVLGKSR